MAKRFNLDDYDLVQNRIQKFYQDFPNGRILTELMSEPDNENYAVFKAMIYKDSATLLATGWASESRDLELKVSNKGQQYESVNYSSHLENAETSAIGRALANMGRHGDKGASREEMQAVERAAMQWRVACKAIDDKFEGVNDPTSFEETWNELRNNKRWNSKYESYVEEKFQQLMAKENGDLN